MDQLSGRDDMEFRLLAPSKQAPTILESWPGRLFGWRLYPRGLLPALSENTDQLRNQGTEHLSRLREFEPDVILYLGEGEPAPELDNIARDGVWYFQVGKYAGVLRSWLDWLAHIGGRKDIMVALRTRGGRYGTNGVLQAGCFRIKAHYIADSVNLLLAVIGTWPTEVHARQVKGAMCNSFQDLPECEPQVKARFCAGVWWLCKMLGRFLLRIFKRVFEEEQWCIGVVDRPIQEFLKDSSLVQPHWIVPCDQPRFIADPFGLERHGTLYVFYERLDDDIGPRKGVIACSEITESGTGQLSSANAIVRDVHLSYPFLLQHEGRDYCIPESGDAGDVVIYEAVTFPYEWREVAVLLKDTTIIDPTLFYYQERWWLFGSGPEDHGQLTLHIWYSDNLLGPWVSHAANPVKTDIRSTRPAGTPFFHDGHWYRPAQDCSRTYGGRVILNRIDHLDPTGYQETAVAIVEPDSNGGYPDGLHTLSAVGERTLIDGKKMCYSPAVGWHRLRRIFS